MKNEKIYLCFIMNALSVPSINDSFLKNGFKMISILLPHMQSHIYFIGYALLLWS